MTSLPLQIPLNFNTVRKTSLEEFVAGDNSEAIFHLCNDKNKIILLWGPSGAGKTHLLMGLVESYFENHQSAIYLPLEQKEVLFPQMLEGLESNHLICIDDIDLVAGDKEWEKALFILFNAMRERKHKLVVSAFSSSEHINFSLPDLASRFQWGLTYQIFPLSEQDCVQVMKSYAKEYQLELSEDLINYLFSHYSRNLSKLIQLIEKLEKLSLSRQRKLTIPFVKSCLQEVHDF